MVCVMCHLIENVRYSRLVLEYSLKYVSSNYCDSPALTLCLLLCLLLCVVASCSSDKRIYLGEIE